MNTKRRPSRIVYKYVEVPRQTPTTPVEEPTSRSPKESLAYRAWVNCYPPLTAHFELPSPASPASTPLTSSSSSSRSDPTSSSHSSASSPSSRCTTKPTPPTTKSPTPSARPLATAAKPAPPIQKTRAHSSAAVLTKSSTKTANPHTSNPVHSSQPTRPSSRPVEMSYTTTSTLKTKDGVFFREREVVSTHGFKDGKGTVNWPVLRSSDWTNPMHQKVKGKKALASYPHCQQW